MACIYCACALTDIRQKVCPDCKLHHRRVLHYARQGLPLPEAPKCADCGIDLRNVRATICRPCRRERNARDERARKLRIKGPKSSRRCEHCHAPISVDRRRDARFCDRVCLEARRYANQDRSEYRSAYAPTKAELQREWRRKNAARTVGYRARRRHRESNGVVLERDWRRLLRRYGDRCAYCGSAGLMTADHVVPLSRGGRNTIGNLLPACGSCNCRKSVRFLVEWRRARALEAVNS